MVKTALFSAHRDDSFVPVAEVLVCLGSASLACEWVVDADFAGDDQAAAALHHHATALVSLPAIELLKLLSAPVQMLEGEITGTAPGVPPIVVRSIAGDEFEVDATVELLELLRIRFRDLVVYEGSPAQYPGLRSD